MGKKWCLVFHRAFHKDISLYHYIRCGLSFKPGKFLHVFMKIGIIAGLVIFGHASDTLSTENKLKINQSLQKENSIERILVEEFQSALKSPYDYIQSGRINWLLTYLGENKDLEINILASDSLTDQVINSMQVRRNNFDRCVLNIIRYAHIRTELREAAEKALFESGRLALKKIDNPHLALAIFQLGQVSGYDNANPMIDKLRHYIDHDLVKLSLLKVPWQKKNNQGKKKYIRRLQKILKDHPESLLKVKFSKQIGDVYYSMGQYWPMIHWYKKVTALDPTIAYETPIGYRLRTGRNICFRTVLLISIYITYCVVLVFLIITLSKIKKNHLRLLFFRIMISAVIFLIIATCTLLVDFTLTRGTIEASLDQTEISLARPYIPFSIFDSSCYQDLFIILTLGYLPILIAIIGISSQRKQIVRMLFLSIPLIIISSWGHYILYRVYDKQLNIRAVVTKTHIYFDGELEELLLQHPEKVFKVNPQLNKSNNQDLEAFIKENKIPEGQD